MAIPILTVAVTELVKETHKANPDDVFLDIVKLYYNEGEEYLEFSWNRCKRLDIERLAAEYEDRNYQKKTILLDKKIKKSQRKINILEVTIRIPKIMIKKGALCMNILKKSVLDTPSLTIQDSHYDAVERVHLEACSRTTNPSIDVPKNN